MFTPPDAFYAARKVATVKRACEGAGFPLSRDDCRKLVARAWGYACWADVGAAMARGDATGPFDEDLAGHDYVMSDDEEGALRVARRRGAVGTAFCALTRLPVAMGDSFSSRIRLSDDPARSASFGIVDELVGGAWLSPAEFEAKRRRLSEPLPPNLAEFARSLEATMRSEAPGSPPPGRHPPR